MALRVIWWIFFDFGGLSSFTSSDDSSSELFYSDYEGLGSSLGRSENPLVTLSLGLGFLLSVEALAWRISHKQYNVMNLKLEPISSSRHILFDPSMFQGLL
jgi:hypothetical protein